MVAFISSILLFMLLVSSNFCDEYDDFPMDESTMNRVLKSEPTSESKAKNVSTLNPEPSNDLDHSDSEDLQYPEYDSKDFFDGDSEVHFEECETTPKLFDCYFITISEASVETTIENENKGRERGKRRSAASNATVDGPTVDGGNWTLSMQQMFTKVTFRDVRQFLNSTTGIKVGYDHEHALTIQAKMDENTTAVHFQLNSAKKSEQLLQGHLSRDNENNLNITFFKLKSFKYDNFLTSNTTLKGILTIGSAKNSTNDENRNNTINGEADNRSVLGPNKKHEKGVEFEVTTEGKSEENEAKTEKEEKKENIMKRKEKEAV
ncbi:hypothetical protein PFISCL1PPCAC_10295, partial [Pristionchus fissidentatus]